MAALSICAPNRVLVNKGLNPPQNCARRGSKDWLHPISGRDRSNSASVILSASLNMNFETKLRSTFQK